ncbi:MAG: helix-turn-helix transcriptional regulator [Verrucomicrobiales bacterium]|nr:helix-turn-helix transcriptional regulator [Verrucomicrobiales bacterium]
MPRPPSFYHPLRDIRKVTDFSTQAEFAKRIGVAAPTIQAIENGKLEISRKLALRIERATGADHRELMKGSTGRPISLDGSRYSREFFEAWKTEQFGDENPGPESSLSQIEFWAGLLIEAAEKKQLEGKASAVVHRLTEALDSVCQDCDLETEVEDLMVPLKDVEYQASAPDEWVGGCEEPGNSLKQIRRRFHPSARVVVSVERVPRWAPGHPVPKRTETPSTF